MSTPLRALIVEDSEGDTALLVQQLEEGGYHTFFKRVDSRQTLKVALQEQQWDVVISDYKLPAFDGMCALRTLQEEGIDIPFILISGYVDLETAIAVMKAGAHDYITKDKLERLIPAIQRELNAAESRRQRKSMEEELQEYRNSLERLAEERTEQWRVANEEMILGSEKYRSLFDNLLNGVAYCRMIFDQGKPSDFIYLDVNKAFEVQRGVKDVVGKKATEVIPGIAESDADLLEIYGRVATTGTTESFERYVKALNMWFDITVYSPKKEYFTVVFDVITERKLADEALRHSEQRYREIVSNSLVGVYQATISGRFLYVNKAMARIFGYDSTAEILAGDALLRYKKPEDRGRMLSLLMTTGTVNNYEIEVPTKEGVFKTVLISGRLEDGTISGMMIDITEQKKLEQQLRQSLKMEAIGHLAGGLAHDLNNILTVIIGYADLTLSGMALDDPQRINIEHIRDSAGKAAQLTKDLLLFSRNHVAEKKYTDINDIIGKVKKLLTRMIGEHISCEFRLDPGSLPALADAHQIEQVLMNLATNARDAMPNGGVFRVSTERITLDNEFITAHGYGNIGKYALITVSDTGQGMDEATMQRVFDPFFSTKEEGKGTGLGMAIVYSIVKGHDGYINVYSETGLGTAFRIYLPMISIEEEVTPEPVYPLVRGKGETILVADDNTQVRKVITLNLETFGYKVIAAQNGEDAVKQYKAHMEEIALIILDVVMPIKNGKDACDEIKLLNPDAKVIFMSGYTDGIIVCNDMIAAENELLSKPIMLEVLLRKVRAVLDGGEGRR
jgi:PAS domain S-box-containing protein